ncbi:hypothetical protein [Candidatus Albibeggiatoa sp. nov. NOAA]|uniref:hypothetical protein n=1 Tax=Candidatus Albibeggiatoa sp. nov. NOAA TaxID=3162724 RepID=UPI003301EE06|nr:hypothetical protein [Thiotrichaceae bacterium]
MSTSSLSHLDLPLERDIFLRTLVRELPDVLEEMIGLNQADGFINIVGQNMGEWVNQTYLHQLNNAGCHVVIYLKKRVEAQGKESHEYYGS